MVLPLASNVAGAAGPIAEGEVPQLQYLFHRNEKANREVAPSRGTTGCRLTPNAVVVVRETHVVEGQAENRKGLLPFTMQLAEYSELGGSQAGGGNSSSFQSERLGGWARLIGCSTRTCCMARS
jgi:hypothetical protein